MIDLKKIKLFYKYRGLYDGFFQDYEGEIDQIMTDEEWYIIDELVSEMYLVSNNLTNKSFAEKFFLKLEKYNLDKKTINYLEKISNSLTG